MKRVRRTIFLISVVFLLGIFCFLFTHFFWQPDSLISFVPQKNSFYLHLDLNPVRRAGCLGNRWLNSPEAGNFIKEISKHSPDLIENIFENRDILDEVGLTGVFPNQDCLQPDQCLSKIDLVFLLKTKRQAGSFVLSGLKKDFYVKNIGKRVWEVSSQPDALQESAAGENQRSLSREKISFSGLIFPSWARACVDSDNIAKMAEKENVFLQSGPLEIRIFSSETGPGDLRFEFKSAGENPEAMNLPMTDVLTRESEQGFVFIIPKDESLDGFEKRIRTGLALERPFEESVLLPDGTRFIELKIDPDKFEFRKERIDDMEMRRWKDEISGEEEPFEIFVREDRNYFYVSNKSSLFKAGGEAVKFFAGEQILKGIYFSFNDKGIRDLMIIETPEKGKGILRFF